MDTDHSGTKRHAIANTHNSSQTGQQKALTVTPNDWRVSPDAVLTLGESAAAEVAEVLGAGADSRALQVLEGSRGGNSDPALLIACGQNAAAVRAHAAAMAGNAAGATQSALEAQENPWASPLWHPTRRDGKEHAHGARPNAPATFNGGVAVLQLGAAK